MESSSVHEPGSSAAASRSPIFDYSASLPPSKVFESISRASGAGPLEGPERALLDAVHDDQKETVTELLKDRRLLHFENGNRQNLLHIAIICRNYSMLTHLLGLGAPVRSPLKSWNSPLHYAVMEGRLDMVTALVDAGSDVDALSEANGSALSLSIEYGDFEILKYLVKKRANVNLRLQNGLTALCLAVTRNRLEMTEVLLGRGAVTDFALTDDNFDVLMMACLSSQPQVIKRLIDAGASLRTRDSSKRTCLHYAAMANNTPAITLLLESGADVDPEDGKGWTPLIIAAHIGHEIAVQILVEKNARVNHKAVAGETALSEARDHHFEQITSYLTSRGASEQGSSDLSPQISTHDEEPCPPTSSAQRTETLAETPTTEVKSETTSVTIPNHQPGALNDQMAPNKLQSEARTLDLADNYPFPMFGIDSDVLVSPSAYEQQTLNLALQIQQAEDSPKNQAADKWKLLRLLYIGYVMHSKGELLSEIFELGEGLSDDTTLDEDTIAGVLRLLAHSYTTLLVLALTGAEAQMTIPDNILDVCHRAISMFSQGSDARIKLSQNFLVQTHLLYQLKRSVGSAETTIAVLVEAWPLRKQIPAAAVKQLLLPLEMLENRWQIGQDPADYRLLTEYLGRIQTLSLNIPGLPERICEMRIRHFVIKKNLAGLQGARAALGAVRRESPSYIELNEALGDAVARFFDETENLEHLNESNYLYQKAFAALLSDSRGNPDAFSSISEQHRGIWNSASLVIQNRLPLGCLHCGDGGSDLEFCDACLRRSYQFRGQVEETLSFQELRLLSHWCFEMYQQSAVGKDLATAMYFERRAQILHSNTAKDASASLEQLARLRAHWFRRTRDRSDIDKAIGLYQESINTGGCSQLDEAILMLSISQLLDTRYHEWRNPEDLDNALTISEAAMPCFNGDVDRQAECLILQAELRWTRFWYYHIDEDKEQAFSIVQKLEQMGVLRGDYSPQLFRLRIIQCLNTSSSGDFQAALTDARRIVESANLPVSSRVQYAWLAGNMLSSADKHGEAWHFLSLAVQLLPQLDIPRMTLVDLRGLLGRLRGLSDLVGFTLLELGRGIIDTIRAVEEIRGFSRHAMLQMWSQLVRAAGTADDNSTLEQQLEHGTIATTFRSHLIERDLLKLGENKAMVAYFVGTRSSKAILVSHGAVRQFGLPGLTSTKIEEIALRLLGDMRLGKGDSKDRAIRNAELREILLWLWTVAVEPVLSQLDFLTPSPGHPLPRIQWIAQGAMGMMPLHAAGDFCRRPPISVSNYAVSSYSGSFEWLKLTSTRQAQGVTKTNIQAVGFVSTGHSTSNEKLDVDTEIKAFQSCFPNAVVHEKASKQVMYDALRTCNVVHCASHGKVDIRDPDQSGIFVCGDENVLMSILDMQRIVNSGGQLAYLSACLTAAHPSQALVDEASHLASAFEQAGFAQVVATTWEVDDFAARDVAEIFYRELGNQKSMEIDGERVARALHKAIVTLQCQNRGRAADPLAWAPFVHFGC